MEGTDPKTGLWDWSLGRIAFLDFESTGRWNPAGPPSILEVAAIVTDRDLCELGRYSAVVDYRDLSYLRNADPVAIDMHLKSGLWKEVWARNGAVPLAEIEHELCQLLEATWQDERPIVWAGASPAALDRPIAQHYMPEFYDKIHYRTIDVSSLHLMAKNYAQVDCCGQYEAGHRAEGDAEDAVELFRKFRALISKKPARRGHSSPVGV